MLVAGLPTPGFMHTLIYYLALYGRQRTEQSSRANPGFPGRGGGGLATSEVGGANLFFVYFLVFLENENESNWTEKGGRP